MNGIDEIVRPLGIRTMLLYGAMLIGSILAFLAIAVGGSGLEAPLRPGPPASVAHVARASPHSLSHVLVALIAVLVTGRILGMAIRRVGQPPVIGEVLAGILLGPSFLGNVWPEAATFVLPASIAPTLGVLAQLGVILYLFLVGLEFDASLLRAYGHAAVAISHASIILPFMIGAVLALILYPRLSSRDVPFTSFALFLGVAMSVTAFPVLARILTDRKMQRTRLGTLALGCAAIDDVTAWCLLALVVGVVQADFGSVLRVLILTAVFVLFMLCVVRPSIVGPLARRAEENLTHGVVAIVFAALLSSALMSEMIGIHALFGAFLFGAIVPQDGALARGLAAKLEDLVSLLLLPTFFALTGMRTRFGLLTGLEEWLLCGLIILAATVGKFGGTFVAARLVGLGWKNSTALGVLMNTRGLMELIVLNVGLELGVISPTLFTMMVLMALATTMATAPALQLLGLGSSPEEMAGEATRNDLVLGCAAGRQG